MEGGSALDILLDTSETEWEEPSWDKNEKVTRDWGPKWRFPKEILQSKILLLAAASAIPKSRGWGLFAFPNLKSTEDRDFARIRYFTRNISSLVAKETSKLTNPETRERFEMKPRIPNKNGAGSAPPNRNVKLTVRPCLKLACNYLAQLQFGPLSTLGSSIMGHGSRNHESV